MGAAEVTLGRLHRNVTEEELNLLQFAAGCATKSSATPPKIVRRKFAHSDFRRELLDDVPNELLRHPFAPNLPSTTHAAEETAIREGSLIHKAEVLRDDSCDDDLFVLQWKIDPAAAPYQPSAGDEPQTRRS